MTARHKEFLDKLDIKTLINLNNWADKDNPNQDWNSYFQARILDGDNDGR